jgi:hypothetical protein
MIPKKPNPAAGGAAGSAVDISLAADASGNKLPDRNIQAQNVRRSGVRPRLRLVAPSPPPRPRRVDVQISVRDGPAPIGPSRPFRLTLDELFELIAHLESIEER